MAAMKEFNQTAAHVSYFIISGFPELQDWPSQTILFSVFLLIYIATLLENIMFVVIIKLDENLHSPMYAFIFQLALLDLSIPSVTVPEMLHYLLTKDNAIGFVACIFQMSLFRIFNTTEGLILTVMAYDRYQAICNPLHYHSVMTIKYASWLSIYCWTAAVATVVPSVYLTLVTPLCGRNVILNFYCDYSSITALACGDTRFHSAISLSLGLISMFTILGFVTFSYAQILLQVLGIASPEDRWKAFSTCASHLFVISVFMLVTVFVAICSRILNISDNAVIMAAVVQNILPPLANPIIYCLKTKEIRRSLVKLVKRSVIGSHGR
ncbi:olfactory receptor 6N1-like [Protopterus annectens]|uniref:olfactory receptor 6N1-like n=1 Tax=Protopterus annectens TaxID=7888 RepID=UPI001CFAF004|nr:olfactory receptor 6N1-like [Protopterus annectens]